MSESPDLVAINAQLNSNFDKLVYEYSELLDDLARHWQCNPNLAFFAFRDAVRLPSALLQETAIHGITSMYYAGHQGAKVLYRNLDIATLDPVIQDLARNLLSRPVPPEWMTKSAPILEGAMDLSPDPWSTGTGLVQIIKEEF